MLSLPKHAHLLIIVIILLSSRMGDLRCDLEINRFALQVIDLVEIDDVNRMLCGLSQSYRSDRDTESYTLISHLQTFHQLESSGQTERAANLLQAVMLSRPAQYLQEIENLAPQVGDLGWFRLGLSRFFNAEFDTAAQIWDEIDAGNYLLGAGDMCRDLGESEAAESWYQVASELALVKGRAFFAMGLMEYNSGNFSKAVKLFYSTLDSGHQTAMVYLYTGAALTKDGRGNEAISILAQGLEKYPQIIDLWLWYGEAAITAGQIENSIELYQGALALEPYNVYAHLGLARSYLYLNENDSKSLEHIRAVLDIIQDQTSPIGVCDTLISMSTAILDQNLVNRIVQKCSER